jgi:phenylalanyl-tRNA synthetase alpha chain
MDTSKSERIKTNIINDLKNPLVQNLFSLDISKNLNLPHQEVVGECKSLEMAEVIVTELQEKKLIDITPDGKNCLEFGSPEYQLMKLLETCSIAKKEIKGKLPLVGDRGFAAAMKLKYIDYDKTSDLVSIKSSLEKDTWSYDEQQKQMQLFSEENDASKYNAEILKIFQKNFKFITVDTVKYFRITKGNNFDIGLQNLEKDLTFDLLQNDNWEKVKFKKFNYNALGKEVNNGALHPLLRVRTQFREILLEMNFQEMPTNCFVESSFWNFDSLFQPQQHPARDAHDTFFVTNPRYSKVQQRLPEYFQRVCDVHENGGYGSIGWKYNWSAEEATKNLLRTHTTSVSSKMLFKLAEEYKKTGTFTPKKYFSIDRVFRNESLDATHLAEFHQIEGLIADYNLGLGHLIGTIEGFFNRFGIKKLRFKPAYNPYTEPSMEIFAYHEGFKKWVEVGNSGIFRPEMLEPMGLPKDVSVIAWGLSLERPTMIHYGLKNIRDLFGHEVNVNDTKNASIYCININ